MGRTEPGPRSIRWATIRESIALAGLVWVAYFLVNRTDPMADTHAYWYAAQAGVEAYGRPWSAAADAFVYSPAFWQAVYLPAQLPYEVFHAAWVCASVAALAVALGPSWAFALLTFGIPIRGWPVWEALLWGNVEAFMVLAIALSFRFPAAWAVMFLTKVTPGVGTLWYAGRREWRKLLVAVFATVAIVAISFLMVPQLWAEWATVPTSTPFSQPFAAPLWVRLGVAAVLVYCGGRLNQSWTVWLAVAVAHPAIWVNTLTIPLSGLVLYLRNRPLRERSGSVLDEPSQSASDRE
jgi:hypothetical protein